MSLRLHWILPKHKACRRGKNKEASFFVTPRSWQDDTQPAHGAQVDSLLRVLRDKSTNDWDGGSSVLLSILPVQPRSQVTKTNLFAS